MLAKTKLLALCCFALLFGAGLFFVGNQQKAQANICQFNSDNFTWVNAYKIDCNGDFYFDPARTVKVASAFNVFAKDDGTLMLVTNDGHTAARVPHTSTGDIDNLKPGEKLSVTFDCSGGVGGRAGTYECVQVDSNSYSNATNNDGDKYCTWQNYLTKDSCQPYNGPGSDGVSNRNTFTPTDAQKQAGAALTQQKQAATNQAIKNSQNCQDRNEAGALSFIFCPLLDSVTTSIDNIVGPPPSNCTGPTCGAALQSLLKVQPLAFPGTSGGINLQPSTQNIIYLADALYVLLFIILLFANTFAVGLDNYTVKKTLPRLIAAVVLTQFAYIICAFMIDFGNILGSMLPNLITSVGGIDFNAAINNLLGSSSQAGSNSLLAGLGAFFLVLIAAFAILIVLIISMIYLFFRNLLLYVLVIVSPIAFAAMVLPGTQKYFKMWGTNFIKLILMFPIITSILAVAAVLSAALAPVNALLAAIIPVVALALIPKTFKWSGDIMEFTAGAVAGYAGGKATAQRKNLPEHAKNLQERRRDALAMTKFGQGKGPRGTGRLGTALAGGGIRNSRKNLVGRANRQAKLIGEREKAAGIMFDQVMAKDGSAGKLAEFQKQFKKADAATQASLLTRAAQANNRDMLNWATGDQKGYSDNAANYSNIKGGKEAYDKVVSANYGAFDNVPEYRGGFKPGEVSAKALSEYSGGTQAEFLSNPKMVAEMKVAVQGVVKDDKLFGGLNPVAAQKLAATVNDSLTPGHASFNGDPEVIRVLNDIKSELGNRGVKPYVPPAGP